MVQRHLAGEKETHWDKTNKELTSSKMIIFIICLSCPSAFLAHQQGILYHVTDQLQRAHLYESGVYKVRETSLFVIICGGDFANKTMLLCQSNKAMMKAREDLNPPF